MAIVFFMTEALFFAYCEYADKKREGVLSRAPPFLSISINFFKVKRLFLGCCKVRHSTTDSKRFLHVK